MSTESSDDLPLDARGLSPTPSGSGSPVPEWLSAHKVHSYWLPTPLCHTRHMHDRGPAHTMASPSHTSQRRCAGQRRADRTVQQPGRRRRRRCRRQQRCGAKKAKQRCATHVCNACVTRRSACALVDRRLRADARTYAPQGQIALSLQVVQRREAPQPARVRRQLQEAQQLAAQPRQQRQQPHGSLTTPDRQTARRRTRLRTPRCQRSSRRARRRHRDCWPAWLATAEHSIRCHSGFSTTGGNEMSGLSSHFRLATAVMGCNWPPDPPPLCAGRSESCCSTQQYVSGKNGTAAGPALVNSAASCR